MPTVDDYIELLEKKPLASSIACLIEARAALDKLDEPDAFSTETVEKDLARMSPELYAFIFRQAALPEVEGESINERLQAAIGKLGFARVKKLIYFHIAFSSELAQVATPLDREFSARLWSLNYRIASTAEYWAARVMPERADELFYLGMLQNLGISAFAQVEPSKHRALRESKRQVPLALKEKEHLGVSHYELGAVLVDRWGLPTMHKSAMRFEETHGQSAAGFADEVWEDLFTLLYFAKYRAEKKKYRDGGLSERTLGIDQYFNYNRLLIQIACDRIRDAA